MTPIHRDLLRDLNALADRWDGMARERSAEASKIDLGVARARLYRQASEYRNGADYARQFAASLEALETLSQDGKNDE